MPTVDLSSYHQASGTGADGTKFDNLIDAVQAALNGLDNNNFASGKIFDLTKLMQGGATTGQLLKWDGANWVAATVATSPGYLLAPQKYGTLIDVVSSAAETDILQAAGYAIPGNTLGLTGRARVSLEGDFLNNTGGNVTVPVFRVYFGGTKIWDSGTQGAVLSTSANRRTFRLGFDLANLNATNSQNLSGSFRFGNSQAATTGIGTYEGGALTGATLGIDGEIGLATPVAIDTTASATLRVTAQLASSAATHELRVRSSLIEFI